MSAVLTMTEVTKVFHDGGRRVVAVDQVSLSLSQGRTVALVGESGCGKSTLGALAVGLLQPDHGRVCFEGVDLSDGERRLRRLVRPRLQLVFQSSADAFAPHLSLGRALRAV
ncbi:MAG: ATP-binding cassette domain-containing protein, partial [Actinomycetia bacterium]|nr:ATP-binding cassette domain-containing protein [Actinomycetes bacterium]